MYDEKHCQNLLRFGLAQLFILYDEKHCQNLSRFGTRRLHISAAGLLAAEYCMRVSLGWLFSHFRFVIDSAQNECRNHDKPEKTNKRKNKCCALKLSKCNMPLRACHMVSKATT